MKDPLRDTIIILATILGVPAGAVLAFFATYYSCVLLWPRALQVGWIFCFLTVPVGAGMGGVLGRLITARIVKRDPDQPPIEPREYPRAVHIAGVIWMVCGCLTLLSAAIFVLQNNLPGVGVQRPLALEKFRMLIYGTFGASFLYVGWRITRGTAKDTLSSGVWSFICGMYCAYLGVVSITFAGGINRLSL